MEGLRQVIVCTGIQAYYALFEGRSPANDERGDAARIAKKTQTIAVWQAEVHHDTGILADA
jgi:hypothetical protein